MLATAIAVAACGSSESKETKEEGTPAAETTKEASSSASESESSGPAIKPIEGKNYMETSASRPTGLGIRPGEGPNGAERQKKAEEAGAQAAEQEGPKVPLPKIKIGVISYVGGTESSDRLTDTPIYAAAQLGWESLYCDPKGEPTKMIECGESLLSQGAKAIFEVAIEAGQLRPVLKRAEQMKVPVFQMGGGEVPAIDGMTGSYGPNEHHAGLILGEWLMEKFKKLPGTVEMAVQNFPANWGKDRTAEVEKLVKGQSKVKIVSNVMTNATNLTGFTREATTQQITQHPNLKEIWYTYDITAQVGGTVVSQHYPGKEFPERPLVSSFHADLQTLADMEKGLVTVDSEVNYPAGCWEAVNEAAEYFARKRTPSKKNQPTYPVIGDPFSYEIITKENLPPKGQYVQPKWDVPSYFISKWHHEFTEGS